MKFLLVEDNKSISEGLEYAFKQNNYKLEVVSSVEEARDMLSNKVYDLVIMDIMLPDGDGRDFYKEYVKYLNIPVLFLTAIDDEESVVDVLNSGASEYMTKPFSTKELLVRIKRILNKNSSNFVIVKNIKYDFDKMVLTKNEEVISLSSLEIKILNLLFNNIGKTVSRNILLDKIWEWTGNDVDDHTITVYLKRIREKINEDIIVTVKGIGYRIDVDES